MSVAGAALATLLAIGIIWNNRPTNRVTVTSGVGAWLLESEGYHDRPTAPGKDNSVLLNVGVQLYEEGRGLGTTKVLRRGDVAAWVPEQFALNVKTSSMPVDVLDRFANHAQQGRRTIHLAAILLFESAFGNSSRFYQLLEALPTKPEDNSATWSMSQQMLFSSVTGMEGSNCEVHLPKFVQKMMELQQQRVLPDAMLTPVKQWSSWNSTTLQRRSQWACSMAISRNFASGSVASLYPMLDMANHNASAVWGEETIAFDFSPTCVPEILKCISASTGGIRRATAGVVSSRRCFQSVRNRCMTDDAPGVFGNGFVALREFQPGEQIFDNYGQQSNLRLLFQWGFIDAANMAGSDAIFDWRAVSYLWEDENYQWKWMSQSQNAIVSRCAELFDKLTVRQTASHVLPELRLNLNSTAAPHGFNTFTIDCIRILAQNFTSESELYHEIALGTMYLWEPGLHTLEKVDRRSGETFKCVQHKCVPVRKDGGHQYDNVAGLRHQFDIKLLRTVLATCTEIADRFNSVVNTPAYANVHEQVEQVEEDAEQSETKLHISKQLIHWIALEQRAANACVREITENMRCGHGSGLQ